MTTDYDLKVYSVGIWFKEDPEGVSGAGSAVLWEVGEEGAN